MRKNCGTLFCVKYFSQNFFFVVILSVCLSMSACSTKASSVSLTSQFDLIDGFIKQNQHKDALKELKKVSKKCYDSWSYIGLYKRYNLLGDKILAEKTLSKALKKIPKNPELSAVYAKFLLAENRAGEAEKVSDCLQKTRYASIYAESVFKNHQEEISSNDVSLLYEDGKYFELYSDSYTASRNPVWLRNCAVIFLSKGKYDSASDLTPAAFNDSDDAWFWAQVNFDSGKFLPAINACETSLYYLESMNKVSSDKASLIKLNALEADSYNALADKVNAHLVRERIIAKYITGEDLYSGVTEEEKKILPMVLVNSALDEKNNGNTERSGSLFTYSVMNYPEYVPGLIGYADFAWESNLGRREDDEISALRKFGLKTLEMERYDSRTKIPLSDAVYRIDQALLKVNNPYLYITRLDLRYKSDSSLTVKDKTSDLWKLLESSSSEEIKYHDVLVLYTANFLLENGYEEDAEMIFRKYMASKYHLDASKDFYVQISDRTRETDVSDLEIAALFAIKRKMTDEALRMYEYCVFESAGSRSGEISSKVSAQSALNLANLYFGLAQKDKALDLYGKTASRETDPALRSLAFYRIASIYYAFGDTQNALRSADYAYSIYPENAKAHLLKTKITAK
ncbi:MAG: hypothetical protein MJ185_09385 [Treponema sp.]|nr:hypothetical protein [Treponema sp.]